jgi:2-polyprenyl-3-methyl-5-hydroxy-6-metoxy-1,4-benzoquinol methylase
VIDKRSFDGGLVYGPRTFAELTGRNRVWSAKPSCIYETAERSCPNCGSCDFEFLFYAKNPPGDMSWWDYDKCEDCGMVYTRMAPTAKALDAMYQQGPSQQEWVKLQQNKIEAQLDALKFRWALEKVDWPFGNRRILDIGCSTGSMLVEANLMARPAKRLLVGIEINSAALRVAGARVGDDEHGECSVVIHDKLDTAKFLVEGNKPIKFDVIVLWEVLEHVLDPKTMLTEAWELLAPGGFMILCVPNWGSLAVRIMREQATCFGAGHLNFWDSSTLKVLADKVCGADKYQYSMETIVSYYRELSNYLDFVGPTDSDASVIADPRLPDPARIHEMLLGYKLAMFIRRKP